MLWLWQCQTSLQEIKTTNLQQEMPQKSTLYGCLLFILQWGMEGKGSPHSLSTQQLMPWQQFSKGRADFTEAKAVKRQHKAMCACKSPRYSFFGFKMFGVAGSQQFHLFIRWSFIRQINVINLKKTVDNQSVILAGILKVCCYQICNSCPISIPHTQILRHFLLSPTLQHIWIRLAPVTCTYFCMFGVLRF